MGKRVCPPIKWLLDKTGGALVSWLFNHPAIAMFLLSALVATSLLAYHAWTSLAFWDRFALVALSSAGVVLISVAGKFVYDHLPIGKLSQETPSRKWQQNAPGVAFGVWLLIAVIALLWPQKVYTPSKPPEPPRQAMVIPSPAVPKDVSHSPVTPPSSRGKKPQKVDSNPDPDRVQLYEAQNWAVTTSFQRLGPSQTEYYFTLSRPANTFVLGNLGASTTLRLYFNRLITDGDKITSIDPVFMNIRGSGNHITVIIPPRFAGDEKVTFKVDTTSDLKYIDIREAVVP